MIDNSILNFESPASSDEETQFNPLPVENIEEDEKDLALDLGLEFDIDVCSSPLDLSTNGERVLNLEESIQCLLPRSHFAVQYRQHRSYPSTISISLERRDTSVWEQFSLNSGQSVSFAVTRYKTLKVSTPSRRIENAVIIQGGTRYAIVLRDNAWSIARISSGTVSG